MTVQTMPTMLLIVRTLVPTTVPMLDGSAVNRTMNLGDPLRGRAFRSNRAARDFHCNPVAVCPAARCAHRRCRDDTLVARFDGVVAVTALSSSRRRCAPRSSRCSPRSPWPAAPAAGIAPARFSDAPCLAGAGFAVHRLAHRVVQSRPHKCGQRRRRFRRRAAHNPVQHPLHFPPLNRRGGSDEPLSPAPISRTSMLLDRPSHTLPPST